MYSWLVPRLVFPVWERVSGRRLWTELERLRALQWRSAEELEQRAVARLRRTLGHARAHVPHYRKALADVDPAAIRTVDDLSRVPITTKTDLRRAFPQGVVADDVPAGRRRLDATSGSTAQPFRFYLDRAGDDTWLASYLLFLEWAGTAPWHTQVMVTGGGLRYRRRTPGARLTALAQRVALGREQIELVGPETTARVLRERVARLRRPYFVWAYASYAALLAREMTAGDVVLPTPPRVVVSAAETLPPFAAERVARAFGCPLVNHYSCREIPRFARSCPDRPDRLHVNSERAIVRVVRDDGRAAEPGERGRVVITDLANDVMPFINYDLGDTAVAAGPCPCGRGFPTLGAVEGRTSETLRMGNGRVVSAGAVEGFLLWGCGALPEIWEHQTVQLGHDIVELRVVPTGRDPHGLASRLAGRLPELFGPGVDCRVVLVDQMERDASGKRLVVKTLAARDESARGSAR